MKYWTLACLLLWGVFFVRHAAAQALVCERATPFGGEVTVGDRGEWRPVVGDQLESGYSFSGDAIVDSGNQVVVFLAQQGEALVFTQGDGVARSRMRLSRATPEFDSHVRKLTASRGSGGEVVVTWQGESPGAAFRFSDGVVEVIPGDDTAMLEVAAPLPYAVMPNFLGDDLIYDPQRVGGLEQLCVPSTNVCVGLLEGEDALLTLCWPEGDQRLALIPDDPDAEGRLFAKVRIALDGKSVYWGLITGAGLWHAHPADLAYFEKPMATGWHRPFNAAWIAQFGYHGYAARNWKKPGALLEYEGTLSTFGFSQGEKRTWKATVGWHEWPCWFEDEEAYVQIGKKISPPGQDMLFYFLERNGETPAQRAAPIDIVRRALGDADTERLLHLDKRKQRPLNRPKSVFNLPTCGTTAKIEEYFKKGKEVEERELVEAVACDLAFYFENMEARLSEFASFAGAARRVCDEAVRREASLAAFVEDIDVTGTLKQIASAADMFDIGALLRPPEKVLGELTELCTREAPGNYGAYLELKAEITQRGGALDSAAAKADLLVRGLLQQAGYRCIDDSHKAQFATALIALATDHLGNPTPWEQVRRK